MPGSGDLYESDLRAAVEVTPGVAITTMTRRLLLDAVSFNPTTSSEPVRVQNGTRTNVVGTRRGPFEVTGSFTSAVSPAELIELLLLGMSAAPVVTTPMSATLARDRVFTPGALASATFEINDAAGMFRIPGVQIPTWTLEGTPDGNATFSGDFRGTDHTPIGAMTGSVTNRTPLVLNGWQGLFGMAAFGSSVYTDFLDLVMGYAFTFNNNMSSVYTLRNTQAAKRNRLGLLDVGATMTFDASDAQAQSEVVNWKAGTKKVLRLEMRGPVDSIETGFYEFIRLEMAGDWAAPDLGGETQGGRSYSFPMTYVLDANLAAAIKVTIRSARAAATQFTNS